jgi:hypothetical protein
MAVAKQTQKRLRDGMAAVQAGQRGRGRALLLLVVEQSPDLEEGWWWLSQATDDLVERQQALQKVIALNPDHPQAQSRLIELRLQRLPVGPNLQPVLPASQPAAWGDKLPAAPLETDDGLDNPYQCPYCSEPTSSDDKRCAHCRGSLYRRVTLSGNSEPLRRLELLLGISLSVGILALAAPLLSIGFRQGSTTPANYELLLAFPGVEAFLGNFTRMSAAVSDLLLKVLLARTALLVVLIIGLRARWRLAYYGTMLAMLADLLLSTYLLVAGHLGWAALLLQMALSFGAGLMLFAVSYEFAVNHERLLVRPDSTARGPQDFFQRGHVYRRHGQWALAVAQWRKAVGLAPHEARYYRDLGLGYAQIGRFERSLRALHEARRRSNNPAEVDQIIALVETQASQGRARP